MLSAGGRGSRPRTLGPKKFTLGPDLNTVKLTLKKTNKATGPSHTFVKLLFMVRWAIYFGVAPLCFGTPP